MTARVGLRLGGAVRAGEDRLRLLEAIRDHGGITAAGEAIGLGYRATWDAVQALNNLFEKPLVRARAGGKAGGSAGLTAEGEAALRTLRRLQDEITRTLDALAERLADDPDAAALPDPWSLMMRTSARNALRGRITAITDGAVNAEVALDLGQGVTLTAVVTRRSVADLGLAVGVEAVALIKASFIMLAAGEDLPPISARNRLAGEVIGLEDGAVNSEVRLQLADGKVLTASITREGLAELNLKPGDRATALIKASHVILSVG